MPAPIMPPTPTPLRGGKVLVVDDSAVMRQALDSILRQEHRVLLANDGADGLALARREHPDLILLDVIMPGMDGYAVCAHLKSDPVTEDIPVLFITGLAGEEEETLAFEAGAIDFVVKPFRPRVVAARVRNHVELKRLRDRMRDLALVDGLTGIANRRRFDLDFQGAWARCARDGKPLSLLLTDVDHFKRFNDALGHPAGDACLQDVAAVLSRCVTVPGALVARYGGEEFIGLLPEADLAQAKGVAEGIRLGMQELGLPHPDSDTARFVTLSLGVATVHPAEGGTHQDLLLRADERLYQAKQQGRNRVCG